MPKPRGLNTFWPADIGPGPPPREPPGGAPGTQGRRPRHHGTALRGPQAPMRVFRKLARRHWAGNPPLGAPWDVPQGPRGAAQAPRDRPPRHPGTHARVLNIKS